MEEEAKKYCQCVEPVIEGNPEDGYYCEECKKDICVPDYEPEYNGDEDSGCLHNFNDNICKTCGEVGRGEIK